MNPQTLLNFFLTFLTVAVLVAYAARRLRMPYTIAMVLAGLGLTFLRLGPDEVPFELEPELIFLIFLPGLLFEASYHINLAQLRQNLRPILLLAIPGILLSTAVVGALLFVGLEIDLTEALLFGVLISATDPIAVVAQFKELGVDKRLGTIVEGESLFNDGVAIVLFSLLSTLVVGFGEVTVQGAVVEFFVTMAGGAVLGLVAGFLFGELMGRTRDPLINIALTAILAYGLYFFVEETLHELVSPIVAVVVAGIVVGNYSTRGRTSPTSSHMIVTFWEFAAFLINSAVFLLIGLRVEITALVDNLQPMLLTILAVVIARAVVVYSLRWLINRRPPQISLAWAHVMVWGGMRGAVTIALVLSLPFAVLNRNLFITMAFGYVVFSVVGQGLTLAPLLGRLGLTRKTEQELAFETKIAELALGEAAADTVETLLDENILTVGVAAGVKNRIEDWLSKHEEQLRAMLQEEPELALANQEMMLREITFVQKRTLRRLLERGIISDKTYAIFDERLNERLQGGLTEEDLFGGAEVEGEEIED